ncbi:MAG: 16S rRNA (guanine(966)-N(2))-methyltransferase RsmD [Chloroflexi bacterium RBG_13_51_36]|nr:MAG: 16S rRNA (guanine(966)-N(2))-methyltransferase RsmD [Chloroflexi bacterium RBG_13_51_36]
MRVTGGKVKGTHLKTLPRRSIRPTTSVVKQAIFSLLENSPANWRKILDLYAGTGALGIEALSRRAEWVDFVDCRRNCCDIIRTNLERIGQLHRAHVYCCSVSRALSFLDSSYDIIFMDPPYSDPSANNLLVNLAKSKLLVEGSTIVLCHANRFSLNSDYDGLHLVRERRYGDTFISLYQKFDKEV